MPFFENARTVQADDGDYLARFADGFGGELDNSVGTAIGDSMQSAAGSLGRQHAHQQVLQPQNRLDAPHSFNAAHAHPQLQYAGLEVGPTRPIPVNMQASENFPELLPLGDAASERGQGRVQVGDHAPADRLGSAQPQQGSPAERFSQLIASMPKEQVSNFMKIFQAVSDNASLC